MSGYILIAIATIVAAWPQILSAAKRIKLPVAVAPAPVEYQEQILLARAFTNAGAHVSVVIDLPTKVPK